MTGDREIPRRLFYLLCSVNTNKGHAFCDALLLQFGRGIN
jgi:hypothetical protein